MCLPIQPCAMSILLLWCTVYIQEEEMSDSDEESAEVDDKKTDDNYHVAVKAVNHWLKQL